MIKWKLRKNPKKCLIAVVLIIFKCEATNAKLFRMKYSWNELIVNLRELFFRVLCQPNRHSSEKWPQRNPSRIQLLIWVYPHLPPPDQQELDDRVQSNRPIYKVIDPFLKHLLFSTLSPIQKLFSQQTLLYRYQP